MVVFNISKKWNNGNSRTLTRHQQFDPDDNKVYSAAGENRKVTIDGRGNCTISGNRVRIFALYNNYNSVLTLTVKLNFEEEDDNCSLKLRSRHNEPTDKEECDRGSPLDGNRFGGYGFAVRKEKCESKREPTHNCHDQEVEKTYPDNKTLENEKDYKLRFTVKNEGKKVRQIGEIDFIDGDGLVRVMNTLDKSPKSWMIKRSLYEEKS